MTMEKITDNPVLLVQIMAAAVAQGIDPALVLALIDIESGGNTYAAAIDATQRVNLLFSRPAKCSPETETMMQKTRWGLMQIRGSVARSLGFEGWLTELTVPLFNVELGAKYLSQLTERYGERYGIEGVIAAYQTETPRRIGDRYVNQAYVNAVLQLTQEYAPLAAEIREKLTAETSGDGTEEDTGNTPDISRGAFVPTVDHTAETLNELSKAQLVELAKTDFGLELSASLSKAKLITQVLTAQADTLNFTVGDLEGQEGVSFTQEDTGGVQG